MMMVMLSVGLSLLGSLEPEVVGSIYHIHRCHDDYPNNVLEHINVADILECLMLDSQEIQGFCVMIAFLGALWCVLCSWPPIIAFNC